MIIKKSHNDYWNKEQITTALNNNVIFTGTTKSGAYFQFTYTASAEL